MSRPLLRLGLVAVSASALIALTSAAPLALRRWDLFAVRRVDVSGAYHLTPQAAVAASGITRASNVFEPSAPWRAALRAHPLVADVTVRRRVPGTISLHIVESVPLAFARTPELRAIDERGRVLPADPSAADMDLPVLALDTRVSATGRAADPQTLRVVRLLMLIRRHEPGLLGWISEAGVYGDDVRLVLRTATDADVLVPAEPTPARLRQLHLALADLATPRTTVSTDTAAARSRVADGELARVRRIDVRFHDQIVVALHGRES